MKKTLIAAAAAVALTASAFAEVTFNTWDRVALVPVASNGKDTVSTWAMSWGGAPRVTSLGFSWVSEDGLAGSSTKVNIDAEKGIGWDTPNAWVKPAEWLKVTMGTIEDGALRPIYEGGSWDGLRLANHITDGENWMFDQFNFTGVQLALTPVEGLSVYANIPLDATGTKKTEDAFKNGVYAFGYTVDGIAKIRAQYIGNGDKGEIQAGATITAVENLTLDVGVKYNTDDAAAVLAQTQIPVAVKYDFDGGNVFAKANFVLWNDKSVNKDEDMGIEAVAGVSYAVADGLTATADVRYSSESMKDSVGFAVALNKSFGGFTMGAGFQGTTNGAGMPNIAADASEPDAFVWAIPVVFQFAF